MGLDHAKHATELAAPALGGTAAEGHSVGPLEDTLQPSRRDELRRVRSLSREPWRKIEELLEAAAADHVGRGHERVQRPFAGREHLESLAVAVRLPRPLDQPSIQVANERDLAVGRVRCPGMHT